MTAHDATKRIEEGWEAIKRMDLAAAERLFSSAAEAAPEEPDARNGLGAVHFERSELEESLSSYRKAEALAKKAHGGKLPARLSWHDAKDKAALRALHGVGLNLFRMKKTGEAIAAFEDLLARNPDDNQGVAFLLDDARKKHSLWHKDQ